MPELQLNFNGNGKDAYYFSHDSNARNDPKCLKLRRILGVEGYGLFWILIEMLREAKDYKLPLSYVTDIAYETRLSEEKILAVINNFDLFKIDENLFFSPRLIRSMEALESRRIALSEAGRRGAEARLKQGSSIKVKESKGKKSKLNESIEDRSREFYEKLVPYVQVYGKDMIRMFYDYWSETGEGHKKMRWETEKTFEIPKRLARWKYHEETRRTTFQLNNSATVVRPPSPFVNMERFNKEPE